MTDSLHDELGDDEDTADPVAKDESLTLDEGDDVLEDEDDDLEDEDDLDLDDEDDDDEDLPL